MALATSASLHMDRPFRWGIASTANVNRHILSVARAVPSKVVIVAVASRSAQRAKEFAEAHNIPLSFGCYDDMFACPNIDGVYVSTHHAGHKDVSIAAMRHGKHVLCEKPLALTGADAAEMFACARECGVILAEGCMNLHSVVAERVRTMIQDNVTAVGKLLGMRGHWTMGARGSSGGSALYGLGCYVVNFARFVACDEVSSVSAVASHRYSDLREDHNGGNDAFVSALVRFRSGMCLTMECGASAVPSTSFECIGTEGSVHVANPFKPSLTSAVIRVTTRNPSSGEWTAQDQIVSDDQVRKEQSGSAGVTYLYQLEFEEFFDKGLHRTLAPVDVEAQRARMLLTEAFSVGGVRILEAMAASISRNGEQVEVL